MAVSAHQICFFVEPNLTTDFPVSTNNEKNDCYFDERLPLVLERNIFVFLEKLEQFQVPYTLVQKVYTAIFFLGRLLLNNVLKIEVC